MKRARSTFFLLMLTFLMLSAGAAAGILASRLTQFYRNASDTSTESATLVEQLHLTPEQRDRMRTIWEMARDDIRDCYHDADSLQRQRDQAIASILTDKQKAEFEKIAADYANRFSQLNQKRDQTIQSAVDRTNQLLDSQQRDKYQRIIRSRLGRNPSATVGVASPAQSDRSLGFP